MEVDDDLGFEIGVSDNEFELENEYVDVSEAKGGENENTKMEIEEKVADSLEDGEQENRQGSSKQQDLREKLAKKRKQKKQKKGDHERDDERLQRSKFYGYVQCAECGTCNSLA